MGCTHPIKCSEAGNRLLTYLRAEWHPDLAPQHRRGERQPATEPILEEGETLIGTTPPRTGGIAGGARVFTVDRRDPNQEAPEEVVPGIGGPNTVRDVTVHIATAGGGGGYENAHIGGGIFFGQNDPRNVSFRSAMATQSVPACEVEAIFQIIDTVHKETHIHIRTRSGYLGGTLGGSLPANEASGWIGTPHKDLLQEVVARMRARTGSVSILQTKKGVPNPEAQEAVSLAKLGSHLDMPPDFPRQLVRLNATREPGAQLQNMTQSLLYRGILDRRGPPKTRMETTVNLDMTRHATSARAGRKPTDPTIWKSIASKDFPTRIRAFLWRTMHGAYKIGNYWRHIPQCGQRADCHTCDVPESMEHILTECRETGQEYIWRATEELWKKKHPKWVKPSLGTILGCGLANFHPNESKYRLTGANRLYLILVSEAMHLIWKLRCEWKIARNEDPERIITENEAHQKWGSAINKRFRLECLMTNRAKYGKKALKQKLVEKTWWGILQNQDSLGDDWVRDTGVLVGIGERPPGRNR